MLVEVPSNIAIRGVGPAIWISVITFCWAMVSMGLAFSRSWISVAVCRAIFGTLAGVSDVSVSSLEKYLTNPFPGSLPRLRIFDKLLVQTKRGPETLRRLLSNGHSSVVLRQYSSKRHHPNRQAHKLKGWRWIYIVEGAITCIAGNIAYPLNADFPDSKRNKFLNEHERNSSYSDWKKIKAARQRTEARLVCQ